VAANILRELMAMVAEGHRAVLFFCVQLNGVTEVSVAGHIDPVYAETLTTAIAAGVEVIVWQADMTHSCISLQRPLKSSLLKKSLSKKSSIHSPLSI